MLLRAILGKAKMPVSLEQYLNEHKEIEKVELCLDNDKTGVGASFFLMQRLMGMGYEVECSVPDEGKDWNDYAVE